MTEQTVSRFTQTREPLEPNPGGLRSNMAVQTSVNKQTVVLLLLAAAAGGQEARAASSRELALLLWG